MYVRCRSQLQNSGAPLEAALALKTGRVETPSPAGSNAICIIDGDADEKKVRHCLRRKRKLTAVGCQEARSYPGPSVASLGHSAAETKVLCRPREKAHIARKETQTTSEEEEATDTDSDEDYVTGKSTEYSFSECETERDVDDSEEESIDSDDEVRERDRNRSRGGFLVRQVAAFVGSENVSHHSIALLNCSSNSTIYEFLLVVTGVCCILAARWC